MLPRLVRSSLALALLGLLAACSDSADTGAEILKPVVEGTSRDSVFAVIGKGPLTASLSDTVRVERGFRRDTYFIDGVTYEVVYYRELPGDVAEPIQQAKETPIVLRDGKVLGWGWRFYVEAMERNKLPNPLQPATNGTNSPMVEPSSPTPSTPADSTTPSDQA